MGSPDPSQVILKGRPSITVFDELIILLTEGGSKRNNKTYTYSVHLKGLTRKPLCTVESLHAQDKVYQVHAIEIIL